jgi:predicted ArsR family transcriptional regulator
MKRNEFLKSACKLGMCSCVGVSLLSGKSIADATDDAKKELEQTMGFIHKRFAKLIEGMNSSVDEGTKTKILEGVGRTCAGEYKDSFLKYKDNLEGFLDNLKKTWADQAEYDKKSKTIRVVGKKQKSCFCPFVNNSMTPKDFCNCSIGFNKESFETVLGKPVDVKIEESILRGGERCTFVITMI